MRRVEVTLLAWRRWKPAGRSSRVAVGYYSHQGFFAKTWPDWLFKPSFFEIFPSRLKKRPDITSGLFFYLCLKAIFVSRNFRIGNSTCPGRHSSMFRQHNRRRPRHDNSRILLPTYRFFSFCLSFPLFHLRVILPLLPARSHCEADRFSRVDQSQPSSTAFEVPNTTTFYQAKLTGYS